VTPGAPATPGAPVAPAAPSVSPQYRETIGRELEVVLSDALLSMRDGNMGPRGIVSLDKWKKEYGKYAAPEQLEQFESRRTQLLSAIKEMFQKDKAKLMAAKDRGDAEEIAQLRSDVAKYADEATLEELETLLK